MAVFRSGIRRGAVAVAAAALIGTAGQAAVLAPVASAHDVVVGGSVEEGKVYDSFPRTITLEFSAIPREGFNTFAVQDKETGETLFDAEPTINDRDLTVETPADIHPGDGEYQVGYQITSSDGHATRGGVSFEVAGSAEGSDAAAAAPEGDASGPAPADAEDDSQAADSQADSSNAALPWILGVGAVLVVAAVAVMLIAKLRSSRHTGKAATDPQNGRGDSAAGREPRQ